MCCLHGPRVTKCGLSTPGVNFFIQDIPWGHTLSYINMRIWKFLCVYWKKMIRGGICLQQSINIKLLFVDNRETRAHHSCATIVDVIRLYQLIYVIGTVIIVSNCVCYHRLVDLSWWLMFIIHRNELKGYCDLIHGEKTKKSRQTFPQKKKKKNNIYSRTCHWHSVLLSGMIPYDLIHYIIK